MIRLSILFPVLMGGAAFAQYRKPVRDPGLIAERTKAFQQDLARRLDLSAQVSDCTHMVQWAVGVRGGNFSYGAICKVRRAKRTAHILLCDDLMMGHFALTNNFAFTDNSVADFTKANCTGS